MGSTPERGRLCGGPLLVFIDRLRLQAVQVIRRALGMGGGREDQPFVVLQCLQ